jgi:hypothetical protein
MPPMGQELMSTIKYMEKQMVMYFREQLNHTQRSTTFGSKWFGLKCASGTGVGMGKDMTDMAHFYSVKMHNQLKPPMRTHLFVYHYFHVLTIYLTRLVRLVYFETFQIYLYKYVYM